MEPELRKSTIELLEKGPESELVSPSRTLEKGKLEQIDEVPPEGEAAQPLEPIIEASPNTGQILDPD